MAAQHLLQHELSNLGMQSIILRPNATKLFRLLEKTSAINYLTNLDHLGVIAASHPSNNHTRWDYIVLQLRLLQGLKNSPINSGLSSSIKELEGISGEDFLQCCILLTNIGHLPGTVSSERAFLQFLELNLTHKTNFLSNILKTNKYENLVNDVFDSKDYYKVKNLIALNFILSQTGTALYAAIMELFLSNPIEKDSIKIGKLKILFFKIRRIAFVYLDGFNSDFPLHLSITKILMDINNYEHLFNPNSTDFEQFFRTSEETLTKKLYINLKTSYLHHQNNKNFYEYIYNRRNNIDFKNFLQYIITAKTPYSYKQGFAKKFKFQSYFSISDSNDFLNIVSLNFRKCCQDLYVAESALSLELNKGLKIKSNEICILNDNRKELIFVNVFFDKFHQSKDDTLKTLKNMNIVFSKIFNTFEYSGSPALKIDFEQILLAKNSKAFIRKYLHFILKFLFKNSFYSNNGDFNVFIKFDYLRSTLKSNYKFNETVFFSNKNDILLQMQSIISDKTLSKDLINTINVMKYIVKSKSGLSKNLKYYCSFLPYDIEQVQYKPELLEKSTSPLSRNVITDIDGIMVIFNDSYFELYIIEGKDVKRGLDAIVNRELTKIRNLFQYPALFSQPIVVNEIGAKGGYIICTNKV